MSSTAIQPQIEEHADSSPIFRGHISELDALRGFGVTMVILAHMWPRQSPGNDAIWHLLNLSWILMDAFFVLSGFLIGGILLDIRSRPDYYRHFYLNC